MQKQEGNGKSESGSEKVRQTFKSAVETVKAAFTVNAEDLEDLYFTELEDIYDAEHRILNALETMSESASSSQTREAFDHHHAQTKEQIRRLERVFKHHDREAERETCEGIEGLIDEATEMMNNAKEGAPRDAVMVASAQLVEHYEMARYGTLRTYADRLGYTQDVGELQATLEEEKETDEKLTEIAKRSINPSAEGATSEAAVQESDLQDLYVTGLETVFDAEHRILEALSTMSKSASDYQVEDLFVAHHSETEDQIRRLERIFDRHDHDHKRATGKGIEGLIDEATEVMKNSDEGPVRDAAMVAAAQTVEHYEIAAYGTLCAYAEQLGFSEDLSHLQATLEEEKRTDERLNMIAESAVNPKAEEAGEDEE